MRALRPDRIRAVLPRVDPARLRSGWPVGLRDGALLALLAAGLNAREIASLQASAITMEGGRLLVTVRRHGVDWQADLPMDLGARLLAWLTERRIWGEAVPVFSGRHGRLSPVAIYQITHRYRRERRNRE